MCGACVVGLVVGGAAVGLSIYASSESASAASSSAKAQIKAMKEMNAKMMAQQRIDANRGRRVTIDSARVQMRNAQKKSSVEYALSIREKITLEHKLMQIASRLDAQKRNTHFQPKAEIRLDSKIESMFL